MKGLREKSSTKKAMVAPRRKPAPASTATAPSNNRRSWEGKRVNLARLSLIRLQHGVDETSERLRLWFHPLSFEDGLAWHSDEGIVGYGVVVRLEDGVIDAVDYVAEFCTCGGHAVGGKAPAWLFPSNPLDEVEGDRLPALLQRRVNCVLGILTGSNVSVEKLKKWHDETETGWIPY